MTDLDFVLHLGRLGVRFWLQEDTVRFSAPQGVLTAELKREMRSRKAVIRRFLERARSDQAVADASLPPLVAAPRDRPLPLAPSQHGMWVHARLEPDDISYNETMAVSLAGAVGAAALERSIQTMIARHEVLRTTFAEAGGAAQQIVHEHIPFALAERDLGALSGDARRRALYGELERQHRRPFDLSRGPLLRACLVRLAPDESALAFTMHHIIADSWSVGVFAREALELYQRSLRGCVDDLAPLTFQYADYAAWHAAWLSSGALDHELAYWRQQLRGAPPVIELPTDNPRRPGIGHAGAQHVFELPAGATRALDELSRREGGTLFMVLLAAFKVLLARYTGQRDIVIGTPIAGRVLPQTESMLGCFVNLLALRTELPARASFLDVLRRVRDVALDAFKHQHVPFGTLVRDLAPERGPGRNPLVQVVFNFHNAPAPRLELPGLNISELRFDTGASKMDLSLEIIPRGDKHIGRFNYKTDLFKRATVERLAAHYCNLLESISADPRRPAAELSMTTARERRRVVSDWNGTRAVWTAPLVLHELFAAQAARTPDAIAVWADGRAVMYRDLDARARMCARMLRSRGLTGEQAVAVRMHRGPEWVAWVLGILYAGGVYMPVSADGPPARIRALLNHARPVIAVTEPELAPVFDGFAGVVIDGLDPSVIVGAAVAGEPAQVSPERLAYLIYTSGSTGVPKGVEIPHRAICNHLLHRGQRWPLGPGDRFVHKASAVFDIAIWELFAPLVSGATAILARPNGQRDCGYLARLVVETGATDIHFLPSILDVFLEQPRCPTLRRVFCGGEPMSQAQRARFYSRYPGVELVHQYGPTEATVDATMERVPHADGADPIPIGRPIANTTVYVLDELMLPAPLGAVGEVFIGGAGVARGYLGAPAATAQRFVPDPFSDEPGQRLYRTGDRARWLTSGELQFVGRVDHQVKLRGYRIELGEIEAALRLHDDVADAVVTVQELGGSNHLCAFVTGRRATADAAAIKSYLQERLPGYLVPTLVTFLDALPVTATGKVDRGALPRAALPEPAGRAVTPEPADGVEAALSALFADVLCRDRVGIDDDFFESGGDSLAAARLVTMISERLGASLGIEVFFERPTVRDIAEHLRASEPPVESLPATIVPLRASGSRAPLFCIHPAGGHVYAYRHLAAGLGDQQPVYGVIASDLGAQDAGAASIPEMAAEYADAIRRVQPGGPYHLLGWSMGGVIAVSVADALERAGGEVAFVVLLDAFPGEALPADASEDPIRALAPLLGGRYASALEELGPDGQERLRRLLVDTPPEARLGRALEWARDRGALEGHLPAEFVEQQGRVIQAHLRALGRHVPPRIAAALHVFWASEPAGRPTPDWSRHTRAHASVDVLAGNHFSLLEPPGCERLVSWLADLLPPPPMGTTRAVDGK